MKFCVLNLFWLYLFITIIRCRPLFTLTEYEWNVFKVYLCVVYNLQSDVAAN